MDSVLDFMKKDHERIAKLLDKYRQGKVKDTHNTLKHYTKFKDELFRHIDWEEQIFFPLLDNAIKTRNSTSMEGFRKEHSVLREYVREIYLHLAAGDFEIEALDTALQQFLKKHKDQEVNGLYILIDKKLTDNQRHDAFKKLAKELYF